MKVPLLTMRRDWVISHSTGWHLFAIAGFGVGMLAGFTFFLIGPIRATRFLGLSAMACGATGILLMVLALRDHDPVQWSSLVTVMSSPATERD